MLHTKSFQKSMEKKRLWEKVQLLIERAGEGGACGSEERIAFIRLIDAELSPDERLAVMEELGCCKSDKSAHRNFYKKYADIPLKERISRMDEIESVHKAPTVLNDDGTMSVFWAFGEEGSYTCPCGCGVMRKIKSSKSPCVTPTFCACCGGHVKAMWEAALGVKLRLKRVVSSTLTTQGRKRCEFLFDILDEK